MSRGGRWQVGLRREAQRFLLLLLVVCGVLSGLAAVVFHGALAGAESLLLSSARGLPAGPWRSAALLLLPIAVGAALCTLVPRFAPQAGGGLSLVRGAYARDPRRLSGRTLGGTFLATPLSLGAGVPLGPEGPTVVLTSGISVALARALQLPPRVVRGMIPVGTAAGIAAIFNTPITGVVFALEEVIGTASRGVLGGAIVAAVAAAVVQKQLLGGAHLLPAAPGAWRSAPELIGFALLGVVAGVAAGALPRAVRRLRALRRPARRPLDDAARGALAGAYVGLLGLLSPDALGIGYPVISRFLDGGGSAGEAGLAFAVKFAAVALALATPLVGGVFAPSLFLGASVGAALGHAIHDLFPNAVIDPGAYALVGMGAFFAGFLRTPIASVLIVFELTGDYGLVAPLMLAVVLASVVARRLSPATLVEQQLESEGVSADAGADPLAQLRARDVMSAPPICLLADERAAQAWQRVSGHSHRVYPVVDTAGLLLGLIDREALAGAAANSSAGEPVGQRMYSARVLATPDEPLDRVSLRLGAAGETRCAVVESPERPRVLGVLTPGDLLRARLRASVAAADATFRGLTG
ncbi:MAG: chloride channel protein [Vicinamibacteria bacterium]